MRKVIARVSSSSSLFLIPIFLYAMKLRHAVFSSYKGLYCKGTDCDIDGYLAMSKQIFSGNWEQILRYRPTQLLYPILLSPIHLFHLKEQKYVYLLHSALTLGTLVFVYLSGKRLHSKAAGLLAALLIANHNDMVFWFVWMFTEYLYYFLISLFVYLVICVFQSFSLKKFLGLTAYFVLLFGTKPEAIAPFFPVFLTGVYLILLSKNFTPKKARNYIASSLVIGAALFFVTLGVSNGFRHKVFSHLHIAHGLWLSTHTGEKLNEAEQGVAYTALSQWVENKSFVTLQDMQEAMSYEGIRLIQQDPVKHLKHIGNRFLATLYTWKFSSGWSKEMKLNDAIYTLFITSGSLLLVLLYSMNRLEVKVLFSSTFCMLLFVAIYHLDGDYKFRLPIHILLTILGVAGWGSVLQSIYAVTYERLTTRKVNIA